MIDLAPFADGAGLPSGPASAAAAEIDAALRRVGFLTVTGHGVEAGVKARYFDAGVDRYSSALFVTPPFHLRIETLPTCLDPDGRSRHQPLVAGPYLLSRFDGTHAYRA